MKYGVQLYNFRAALSEDFKGAMKEIAKIGFDGAEFAFNFGGMSPDEITEFMKEINFGCCGAMFSGQNLTDPNDVAWEYTKKLAPPAISISANTDFANEWKSILDLCLAIQKNAEAKNVIFSYHNHWAEFAMADGVPAMYRILDAPGAEKIYAEPDVCWLTRGGMDPAAYIRKYADRIKQIHFKDIMVIDDANTTATLGKGLVDLKSAYAAAKEINAEWLIFEQDNSEDPFQSAADSLAYMKSL